MKSRPTGYAYLVEGVDVVSVSAIEGSPVSRTNPVKIESTGRISTRFPSFNGLFDDFLERKAPALP